MANSRSDLMANMLASPQVLNDVNLSHGRKRIKIATITYDNTEAAGHLTPLARFKATDSIVKIEILNTAGFGAGATDNNIGLWTSVDWTAGDGTAKDADIYVDGASIATTARTKWTDVGTGGAGERTVAQYGRRVWQDAGDSAQPAGGTTYDLVWQAVTDPAAAGTVKVKVEYIAGD